MRRTGPTERPSYVRLARSGELLQRTKALDGMLSPCAVCPRECRVDRRVELGTCATGSQATVASWTPHFGEEPVISGVRGSGTIFLANCNLRCVFCQNHDISQRPKAFVGGSGTDQELASIHLELQDRGCHNINWVSPSHQVPQLVRALALAADRGLSLPIVYNSNAYDGLETLRLLDGIIDVYMPDFKYSDPTAGALASRVPDYPERARLALMEMYRQVGPDWQLGPDGTLERGLLVRVLVLPNDLAGVEESLSWIAEELSPKVGISLMAQYYPAHLVARTSRYPLLARTISAGEWARALSALERHMMGEHHFVQNRRLAPAYYRPDFSDTETPFADIEDFI
jgi:putative pyruvate formate lyase activating enzyme